MYLPVAPEVPEAPSKSNKRKLKAEDTPAAADFNAQANVIAVADGNSD